jgi:adiponectin receptor
MAYTVTLEKMTTVRSCGGADVASPTTMRSPLLKKPGKGGSGGYGKKGRCCGHEYELIGYDALPEFLKHNEFILDYYRSEWPIKQALLSAFSVHNETINVWT